MKCPECVAGGKKSTVQDLGGSATLLSWTPHWDQDGVYHRHDPNRVTYQYRCGRGHLWTETLTPECPNCDYGEVEEVVDGGRPYRCGAFRVATGEVCTQESDHGGKCTFKSDEE